MEKLAKPPYPFMRREILRDCFRHTISKEWYDFGLSVESDLLSILIIRIYLITEYMHLLIFIIYN